MDTIFQAYGALTLAALVPIYFGAHSSVKAPLVRKRRRTSADVEGSDSDSEDEEAEVDRLTAEDAYWFPVMGSAVLFGLWVTFKYLDKDLINLLLSSYFLIIGSLGITTLSLHLTKHLLGPTAWAKTTKYKFRLTKDVKEVLWSWKFTNWHMGLSVVGVVVCGLEWWSKHWVLSDLLALAFAFNAIGLLKLDSFKTGTVLLGGLFFYDVWWVFGSRHAFGENVMVSVAKNFDAPIKITWPKDMLAHLQGAKPGSTMLGLGDIVIPGVFVALALRYDYHRALARTASGELKTPILSPTRGFSKPYFYVCFASYIAGLATTMAVMHVFKAAQPALLYLSPACTGSVALFALIKGDWNQFWTWQDGQDDEKKPEEKEKDKKESKRSRDTTPVPKPAPKPAAQVPEPAKQATPPSQPVAGASGPAPAGQKGTNLTPPSLSTDEDWTSGGVSDVGEKKKKKKKGGKK